jgi:hypothetical protein
MSLQLVRTVKADSAPAKVMGVKKSDAKLQIVWGEVYAPGFPDSQGDFMTPETIRDMSYDFMRKSELDAIDTQHTREKNGSYIVESFVARENDPDFIPGAWVIGVRVPNAEVWAQVEKGELNGFSLDGTGLSVPTVFEVEIPEMLTGRTLKSEDGHDHEYFVEYDEDGTFLGGRTTPAADGHFHIIKRGTVTEDTNGHNHRFSFVEGILNAQARAA